MNIAIVEVFGLEKILSGISVYSITCRNINYMSVSEVYEDPCFVFSQIPNFDTQPLPGHHYSINNRINDKTILEKLTTVLEKILSLRK